MMVIAACVTGAGINGLIITAIVMLIKVVQRMNTFKKVSLELDFNMVAESWLKVKFSSLHKSSNHLRMHLTTLPTRLQTTSTQKTGALSKLI